MNYLEELLELASKHGSHDLNLDCEICKRIIYLKLKIESKFEKADKYDIIDNDKNLLEWADSIHKLQQENKQLIKDKVDFMDGYAKRGVEISDLKHILGMIEGIIDVAIEEDGYIEPEMNLSKIEQLLKEKN